MSSRPLQQLSEWSQAWLSAWNLHNVTQIVSLCSPSYEGVDIAQAAPHFGQAGMQDYANLYLRAFPDLQITLDEMVAQENQLVLVWKSLGTHRGILMNIPPSGHVARVRGVSILTIENGWLSRALYMWDLAGWLREIGLLPEL